MRKLITLVLLFWVSTGQAQQDIQIDRVPLNPMLYEAMVIPLLKDVEKMLNIDLGDDRPQIFTASREQISLAYCEDGSHCSVMAVTNRRTGEIYLSMGFSPNNLMMASVLFHELVHWVQVTKGYWAKDPDCVRWAKQEMQGYRLQSIWLVRNGGRTFEIPNLMDQCR